MEDFERVEELKRQRIRARRRKRWYRHLGHITVCSAVVVIFLSVAAVILKAESREIAGNSSEAVIQKKVAAPVIQPMLLTPNEYSRPGTELSQINGIVIHYTGNPGTTAIQNRNYFEGLAQSKQTKASSHYIVGLSGEILQCVPLDEVAYASNQRNGDTISIECCIDNEEGKFKEKTYDALVHLTAWLMGEYDLDIEDVIRHYDVTGKNCPKYFVEHESAWEDFKLDVTTYIESHGTEQ